MSGYRTEFSSKAAAIRALKKLQEQSKETRRMTGRDWDQLSLRDLYIKEETSD